MIFPLLKYAKISKDKDKKYKDLLEHYKKRGNKSMLKYREFNKELFN